METKQEKIERLNRLGIALTAARKQQNKDEEIRLSSDIFLLAEEIFSQKGQGEWFRENIGRFYLKHWHLFDADRGPLYRFIQKRMDWVEKESYQKDHSGHWKTEKPKQKEAKSDSEDTETGEEKKREWVRDESYDALAEQTGNDLGTTSPRALEDEKIFQDGLLEFITLILTLPEHLTGRANNPERINYFRLFFTDDAVRIIQEQLGKAVFYQHERDLFSAMQLKFLDYFMSAPCRSVREIAGRALKLYGELVPGGAMEEPKQPFPNDLYLTYRNTQENATIRSVSTITNQRNAYKDFLKQELW